MPTRSESVSAAAGVAAAAGRAFLYRFLAEAFAHPEPEGWAWVRSRETADALRRAAGEAWPGREEVRSCAENAVREVKGVSPDAARADHLRAFGYTIRGACPPHEIEYGDTKADALFRPHRLADLASLYRAFGIEMGEETHERQDHLAIECEFASILAARLAHALQENHADGRDACESAWRLFLRDHLGRWTPAFVARLSRSGAAPWLRSAAGLLLAVVRADGEACGVRLGSSEIELVSYDEEDDAFCTEQCGVAGSRAAPTP